MTVDFKFAPVDKEYEKDKKLRKEDVKALMEWVDKQGHLPKINELQAIHFLHSCFYSNEAAKVTIDNFFTLKTACSDIFGKKNTFPMETTTDICIMTILPKKTPEGDIIIFIKFMDTNSDKYNFASAIKLFDMVSMLYLYQEGTSNGYMLAMDYTGVNFGHVTKLGPMVMKRFIYYLENALPVRLKGLHFFNIVPFIDKVVGMMRPFMRKELFDVFYLHPTVDDLTKYIPLECLPKDYGGSVDSVLDLHKQINQKIKENKELFEWAESLVVDESKRLERSSTAEEFGMEGTFKKLEID